MAADALAEVAQLKKRMLAEDYGGSQTNQFVADMKASTLFQLNWGELLSAAPTALSLMGACWIAASSPSADQITMTKSVPAGGFKFIVSRSSPTLRSMLVDVCSNGGRDAFNLAARNMEELRVRSHSIINERITIIMKRLPACSQGPDRLEDFQDALRDLVEDARKSAVVATKTREAFSKWGSMVGELHAAVEEQQGQKSVALAETSNIEQAFAVQAADTAKKYMGDVKEKVARSEKGLDLALDNVPGSWESAIQGAVTGFAQEIPSLVGGIIPLILAGSNPRNAQTASADVQKGVEAAKTASDPSYATAGTLGDLATYLYELLGGDKSQIDGTKFEPGTSYLLATLKGNKSQIEETGTASNKQLIGVIDGLLKVVDEIPKGQTDFNAAKVDGWKKTVKDARTDLLKLAASAPTQGGVNVPAGLGIVKVDVSKTDFSAQNAQLSSAMQDVSTAENAAEIAQNTYDAAIKKQAETAKAMSEVRNRLKSLQEQGKTLDEIKQVLKDHIAVLVDLVIQLGKIEKLITTLTTLIDQIIFPQAERLARSVDTGGTRAARDKYISADTVAKQTIYVSTLTLKAYFSILEDTASMYSNIDRSYVTPGLGICDRLGASANGRGPMDQFAQELARFSSDSAQAVAALVSAHQKEVFNDLKDRAQRAAQNSETIENMVRGRGLAVDGEAKDAMRKGAAVAKLEIQALVAGKVSATVLSNGSSEVQW